MKRLFIILVFLSIYEKGNSQTRTSECNVDLICWDDLYKKIPHFENIQDSISLYEKRIDLLINSRIKYINEYNKRYVKQKEKQRFVAFLKYEQKFYKNYIKRKVSLLESSYMGSASSAFSAKWYLIGDYQFYLLKDEYFYISAIIDNALSNFIE